MVNVIAKLKSQLGVLAVLLFITLLLHQSNPEPVYSAIVVIFSVFLVSGFMPGRNQNLRIALAFAFQTVGFFIYLVIRGLLVSRPIDSIDLPISVAGILAVAFVVRRLQNTDKAEHFQKLGLNALGGSTGLALAFFLASLLRRKGEEYLLAWTGSGDSRNHVQAIFQMAELGKIDLSSILFPQLSTSLAVLISSGNSTELFDDSSSRLRIDLLSYTFTWLILISALAYAYAATWESIGNRSRLSNFNKACISVPISLAAVSSFTLGTYLRDGFVSALAGSVAVAIAVAFVFERRDLNSLEKISALLLIAVFALLSWTLIILPVALLLLPTYLLWIKESKQITVVYLRLVLSVIALLIGIYLFDRIFSESFVSTLNFPGSISAISQNVLLAFLVLLAVYILMSFRADSTIGSSSLLVMIATSLSFVGLKSAINLDLYEQNYYSSKFTTIMIIGVLSVATIFIPAGMSLTGQRLRTRNFRFTAATLLIAVLVHNGLDLISPFPKIWRSIESGWIQPNADTISLVLSLQNDPDNPTVLFKYRPDDPGATRLGDFWLGTYATPREPYQSWSYVGNQEGDIRGFCALNEGYAKMTVLTRDPNLSTRMFANCSKEDLEIRFIK